MNPTDFLEAAYHLSKSANLAEVDYRNIISRSYYAVFHQSRIFLETQKIDLAQSSSHDSVVRSLKKHGNREVKALGNKLDQIKKWRHKADYDLNMTISAGNARSMLKSAYALSKSIENLSA